MRAYVPAYLAINYILFAVAAALGVLQAAALASQNRALIFLAPSNHWRAGFVVACAWTAGAFAIYWFLAPELLTPGPAGGELTALFGLSVLLALGLTRGLARLRSMFVDAPPSISSPSTDQASHFLQNQLRHPTFRFLLSTLILSALIGLYDLPLFRILNGLAGRSALLDGIFQFFINDYMVPTALVLTLLGLWFAGSSPAQRAALQSTVLRALLALAIASIILKLINLIYFRPRPFTTWPVTLLFYHPSDSSFPSNAATVSVALAAAVWLYERRWGTWMLALAGAMAVARVCSGVHFPLDIVAGAWLGGLSAWAVSRATWLDRPLELARQLAQKLALA